MMKHYVLLFDILFALVFSQTASGQQENIFDESKRLTHAIINGEVRANGRISTGDGNSFVFIELRRARDDRLRTIAKTKLKLYNNNSSMQPFSLQFKLKYPLSSISPHNAYILTAKIRNGRHKLLYLGDLHVPVTERKEEKAKHVVINIVPTPAWFRNIAKLNPLAYKVTQLGGTEEAFTSEYYTNKKSGIYTCVVCNSTLFHSQHKYNSGTGWPSFYQATVEKNVATNIDRKFGLTRTEVHCAECKAHLGHVFDDGPPPTYMRYCINGVALQFYPDQSEHRF